MKRFIFFLLLTSTNLIADTTLIFNPFDFESPEKKGFYPNFDDNPYINDLKRNAMRKYLIPLNHPLKPVLDEIFSTRVTLNKEVFYNSGFLKITAPSASHIQVARHPKAPGYVFKLYVDDQKNIKQGIEGWIWLTTRCKGSELIRKQLRKNNIRFLTCPKKWLYPLPAKTFTREDQQLVVLVTKDMALTNKEKCENAWKNITKEQAGELFSILSKGYGSCSLVWNVPYTKSGKFAFIDTEHAVRSMDLRRVKPYLPRDLTGYWDELLKK